MAGFAGAQKLSAVEKSIIKNVDRNLPQTLALLEQLVNINSGTLNVEGVRKSGTLLGKEFEKIGFTTEWISLPDSIKRAGHLAILRRGSKGKNSCSLDILIPFLSPPCRLIPLKN